MIHFSYDQCPTCRKVYDFHFFSISTLIGPEFKKCKCGEIVKTPRLEWAQFDTKTKIRSALTCLVYLGVVGYILGHYFYEFEGLWKGRPNKKIFDVDFEEFKNYYSIGISVVGLLLFTKFHQSKKRFEKDPDIPSEEGLFSPTLTWGAQMKVIIVILFIFFCLGGL